MPAVGLGGILKRAVVGDGGGNLVQRERAGEAAVVAGVAGAADVAHIVFALVVGGETRQGEGVGVGSHSGAGAGSEAQRTVLDDEVGGFAARTPLESDRVGGGVVGLQRVGT